MKNKKSYDNVTLTNIFKTGALFLCLLLPFAAHAAPTLTPSSGGISSNNQTFSYSANGTNVTDFWIWIGSSQVTANYYDSGSLGSADDTHTVASLPVGVAYVTLWYRVDGSWLRGSYIFTVTNEVTVNLNFEELPLLEQLSNQYASDGVVFIGAEEGNLFTGEIGTEPNRGTFFFGNSEPNFVIVGVGLIIAKFQDETSGLPKPVKNVSLRVGDGDSPAEGIGVMAMDQNGIVLESHMIYELDQGVTIYFPFENIFEIRLFGMSGCRGCGGGFAFDDFSYTTN